MFLRNEWYVAALTGELRQQPVARWVLGEPLVLYRGSSGKAAALEDRCAHRGAPISSGCVEGDTMVCGYHGFAYGTDGKCVHVPGMSHVPPQARVRSYPVIERSGWVFVWMGSAQADESRLPDLHWMTDPEWAGKSEHLPVKANYCLIRDNLLDLTHARFVHKKTLGTAAVTDHPIRTSATERGVRVVREMKDIEPSPFFRRMGGFDGVVDHRQVIDFIAPCYVTINTRVSAADGRAAEFYVLNCLTPESAGKTHYFWGLVRNFALGDEVVTETQHRLNRETFEEDVLILERQQTLLDCKPDGWRPLAVPNDGGCVQAERLLDRLLAREAA